MYNKKVQNLMQLNIPGVTVCDEKNSSKQMKILSITFGLNSKLKELLFLHLLHLHLILKQYPFSVLRFKAWQIQDELTFKFSFFVSTLSAACSLLAIRSLYSAGRYFRRSRYNLHFNYCVAYFVLIFYLITVTRPFIARQFIPIDNLSHPIYQ